MNIVWVLVVAGAVALVSCDDAPKDPELEAVQQKLRKLELIEKFIDAIPSNRKTAEQRSDCIPVGGQCTLIAGLNCCGFRNWCNYNDEYVPADEYNPPRYINRCREGSMTAYAEDMWNEYIG
ncbi:uncharacterized protein LOC118189694 [Stegodyphus dumicola]|uniref:uncharacterized protein LOC118189694 n=1 Tax=Stegodyphus dumicola TaxID=202533 RepID=UPI0015B33DFC|nr:uncharacterized protein LOC118189694 [Stegodyphus dumicola]